jgi:hypothetical protein
MEVSLKDKLREIVRRYRPSYLGSNLMGELEALADPKPEPPKVGSVWRSKEYSDVLVFVEKYSWDWDSVEYRAVGTLEMHTATIKGFLSKFDPKSRSQVWPHSSVG